MDPLALRHELRTLINHVIGAAELLRDDPTLPKAWRDDLERILQSGRSLENLTAEFLDTGGTRSGSDLGRLYHDLRTPVNHIIGYAELLIEEAEDAENQRLHVDLRRIRSAAANWLELFHDRFVAPREAPSDEDPHPGAHFPSPDSKADRLRSAAKLRSEATGIILLVDDDEYNRDLLSRRLEGLGHRVKQADSGAACLSFLERSPDDLPDLILLDMVMPDLNGDAVLERLKENESWSEIPVVMISALDDQSGIARCIERGAEDYLPKPFHPAILRARVESCVEKRKLREAEREHLARIEQEQAKSERLLLNVLPRPIAERLKAGEKEIADYFPNVTVLFADLVDFTRLSSDTEPDVIVGLLNSLFSRFDLLAQWHGLEKIKTIGDAYMAVAGLPIPREDHANAIAQFAIDLFEELDRFNEHHETAVSLRVGIDTGPVVAGIIGRSKFIYDLWGDTVNTASRMESHGLAGEIQVTESTWRQLKNDFAFAERGEIEVKGKGAMTTWLLKR
ncbi:MAG: response regulator [Akkermansiaceae bacterium]|nr:response regulator [Akkermansiaceae bacterium]